MIKSDNEGTREKTTNFIPSRIFGREIRNDLPTVSKRKIETSEDGVFVGVGENRITLNTRNREVTTVDGRADSGHCKFSGNC